MHTCAVYGEQPKCKDALQHSELQKGPVILDNACHYICVLKDGVPVHIPPDNNRTSACLLCILGAFDTEPVIEFMNHGDPEKSQAIQSSPVIFTG